MTTREMLTFMVGHGYTVKLLAEQAGVSYYKAYRHYTGKGRGTRLNHADKAALWRFALLQPVLSDHLYAMATTEDKERTE